MTLQELLPPGIYPVWSPYNADEAAEVLMKMLAEEEAAQKLGIKTEDNKR